MKENVLDILMYLFENYVDDGPDFPPDQEALASELAEAGFARGEISKAFTWLEGLSDARARTVDMTSAGLGGMRYFTESECKRLDAACRGFLYTMESSGILDSLMREVVLERLMALEVGDISLEQLKWVTWMVLFHQPGQEYAHGLFENFVFDDRPIQLH